MNIVLMVKASRGLEPWLFSEAITDHLYKCIKLITETEIGTFTTQFVNCKKGIEVGGLAAS